MSEQLTRELIERLAEVLGTTAPYIWGVYLRQQMIQPIVNLIMVLLTVAASVGEIAAWTHWVWRRDKEDDDWPLLVVAALIGGMVGLGATLWVTTTIYDTAMHLLNPEYYVIDALLRAARGGK